MAHAVISCQGVDSTLISENEFPGMFIANLDLEVMAGYITMLKGNFLWLIRNAESANDQ